MGKLTAKQARFVEEYMLDLNATQAAIRAGYSARTAASIGEENLRKPEIAATLREAQQARSERTAIDQDMVLREWLAIATADPNEVISFRRTCCRYCHGFGHAFQWIDRDEFAQALSEAQRAETDLPDNMGGYGFDPRTDPHADCPKCFGEGKADVFAVDTRKLSGNARRLYAGVKVTRDGFEIKLRDQDKALDSLARHLGMFTEKLNLNVQHDDLAELDDVSRAARLAALAQRINRQKEDSGDVTD